MKQASRQQRAKSIREAAGVIAIAASLTIMANVDWSEVLRPNTPSTAALA